MRNNSKIATPRMPSLLEFQGIIYCTCGHLLVESESSQNVHQWRLDVLSIPNYFIKKGRPHGDRHGKTEAQKEHFIAHCGSVRSLTANKNSTPERCRAMWTGFTLTLRG